MTTLHLSDGSYIRSSIIREGNPDVHPPLRWRVSSLNRHPEAPRHPLPVAMVSALIAGLMSYLMITTWNCGRFRH